MKLNQEQKEKIVMGFIPPIDEETRKPVPYVLFGKITSNWKKELKEDQFGRRIRTAIKKVDEVDEFCMRVLQNNAPDRVDNQLSKGWEIVKSWIPTVEDTTYFKVRPDIDAMRDIRSRVAQVLAVAGTYQKVSELESKLAEVQSQSKPKKESKEA